MVPVTITIPVTRVDSGKRKTKSEKDSGNKNGFK
jgi:hypothetical protein